MATYPRIPPDEGKQPQLVPPLERRYSRRRGLRVRMTSLIVLASVIVMGAALLVLSRRPQRAAASTDAASLLPQPNNDELRAEGMQISRDAPGEMLSLSGRISNTGQRQLNGADVEIVFRDLQGNVAGTVRRPIAGIADGNCEVNDEFIRHPIKPNDLRFFCVTVSPEPDGWNHQLPEVQVVTVTSE